MQEEVHRFYQQLQEKGIIFSFSGPISQSLLEGIGQTLKQKMSLEETSTNIIHKVFSIFVELMQNIINYSAQRVTVEEAEQEISYGVLLVGREQEHFYILSGNYIQKEQEAALQDKLTRIKSMDKAELKQYYKQQRRMQADDASKGAGLGFIEMARKASQPIEFEIADIENGYSFFVVKAVI
ncbi:MAG: SiaB family protein kinase [Desulfohalobiaceae bacterium]